MGSEFTISNSSSALKNIQDSKSFQKYLFDNVQILCNIKQIQEIIRKFKRTARNKMVAIILQTIFSGAFSLYMIFIEIS